MMCEALALVVQQMERVNPGNVLGALGGQLMQVMWCTNGILPGTHSSFAKTQVVIFQVVSLANGVPCLIYH